MGVNKSIQGNQTLKQRIKKSKLVKISRGFMVRNAWESVKTSQRLLNANKSERETDNMPMVISVNYILR